MKQIPIPPVPLNEKRCLTVSEFQSFIGVGRSNALKLIKKSKCGYKLGRKYLVDRVAFNEWMDKLKDKSLLSSEKGVSGKW